MRCSECNDIMSERESKLCDNCAKIKRKWDSILAKQPER